MINIFELEIRVDLTKEVNRLLDYLGRNQFDLMTSNNTMYSYTKDYYRMVNSVFEHWKYRRTATNFHEFLDLLGFKLHSYNNELQEIYFLQFLYNINEFIYDQQFKHKSNVYLIKHEIIRENIVKTLEGLNYQVVKKGDTYSFSKRDADVDTVLEVLIDDRSVKEAILSYNDFSIQKNLNQKAIILHTLNLYIQKNKELFKGNPLYNDIGFIVNKFDIRHGDGQITVEDTHLIEIYDLTFKMMLQLIRSVDIKEKHDNLIQPIKSHLK